MGVVLRADQEAVTGAEPVGVTDGDTLTVEDVDRVGGGAALVPVPGNELGQCGQRVRADAAPALRRQVVEYVSRPGAPLVTRASFRVDEGQPGAKKESQS